jgi:hypothetical protein
MAPERRTSVTGQISKKGTEFLFQAEFCTEEVPFPGLKLGGQALPPLFFAE